MSGVQDDPYAQFAAPAPAQAEDPYAHLVAQQPPAAAPPATAQQHPVASEQGNSFWTNLKRAAGTAGINALSTIAGQAPNPLIAPDAAAPVTSQQAREALFRDTGATEFRPQGTPWKIGAGALDMGAMNALSPFGAITMPAALAGGAGSAAAQAAFPNANPYLTGALGFMAGAKSGNMLANVPARLATGPTAGLGAIPMEDAQLANKALGGPVDGQVPIPLGVGQVSNSAFAKRAEALGGKVPFAGSGTPPGQQEAFNRNLSLTMGEDAPRITQDYLANRRAALGSTFEEIAGRNSLNFDDRLLDDLQRIRTNASLMPEDVGGPIARITDHVLDSAKSGNTIPGNAYLDLTRYASPLSELQRSGTGAARYAGQIRDALDDALQRSMLASGNATDLQKLQQARAQWRAMMTIEPLTLRADTPGGATPSTGDISPAALRGRVNQMYRDSGHAPNDLDTLARIGQRFLKEPGSSGTAENLAAGTGIGLGGEALSGLAGMVLGHGYEPGLGAAASLGSSWAGARATNAVLRNQLLARQAVQGSLNPNAFRFRAPIALGGAPGALPFALAPLTEQDRIQPPPQQ